MALFSTNSIICIVTGVISKHKDINCLNCLHSFRTKKRFDLHEKVPDLEMFLKLCTVDHMILFWSLNGWPISLKKEILIVQEKIKRNTEVFLSQSIKMWEKNKNVYKVNKNVKKVYKKHRKKLRRPLSIIRQN